MSKKRLIDLEVSYRNGRPRLAYLHLSDSSKKAARSRRIAPEIVVDLDELGRLIGIEILVPERITLEGINKLLKEYGVEPIQPSDVAPILPR